MSAWFGHIWWRIWSWAQRRKAARQKELFVQVGCGKQIWESWLNLDVRRLVKGAVYWDVHDLAFLPDRSVRVLAAIDILEHLEPLRLEEVMAEWIRVLSSGGRMVIQAPDLAMQAKLYVTGIWDAEKFSRQICGVWDYEYGHKMAFDRQRLAALLERHGCKVLQASTIQTPTTFNLHVIAEKQ